MDGNVISESANLIKFKKRLLIKRGIFSFLIFLGIFLVYLLYIFMYCLGHTYNGWSDGIFNCAPGLSFWPYFDTSTNIFNFSIVTNIYRFIVLILVIVIGVISAFVFRYFYTKKIDKKFKSAYYDSLVKEAKINGVILYRKDIKEIDESDDNTFNQYFELMSLYDKKIVDSYELSTSLNLLKLFQCEYVDQENKNQTGLMIVTSLSFIKSHAFIQLRTNGEPIFTNHDGMEVHKYGFDDMSVLSSFVCFTTLSQEIYLILNKKVIQAIERFVLFTRCNMVIQIKEDQLIILLEGFKLNFVKGLNENLSVDFLEKQAEAFVGLHQSIYKIVDEINGEVHFLPPEKGNGITNY